MAESPTNTITIDVNELISEINKNPKLDEKAIKITEALVEGKKIQKAVESYGQLSKDLSSATTKDEKAKISAKMKEESLIAKRGTKYQQKYFADYYNDKHPPGWIGTAVKDEGTEVQDYMEKKGT